MVVDELVLMSRRSPSFCNMSPLLLLLLSLTSPLLLEDSSTKIHDDGEPLSEEDSSSSRTDKYVKRDLLDGRVAGDAAVSDEYAIIGLAFGVENIIMVLVVAVVYYLAVIVKSKSCCSLSHHLQIGERKSFSFSLFSSFRILTFLELLFCSFVFAQTKRGLM